MFLYILKRILLFIPTFFAISLFTFFLSSMAPGDPVELRLSASMQGSEGRGQMADKLVGESAYRELNAKLGRDLPLFYFSVSSKAYPDTLYKVLRKNERENLARLIDQYNNWPQIDAYYKAVKKLELAAIAVQADPTDSTAFDKIRTVRESCNGLYNNYDDAVIKVYFDRIKTSVNGTIQGRDTSGALLTRHALSGIIKYSDDVFDSYNRMRTVTAGMLKYIPAIQFYGLHNQYHRWLFGDVPWFGENTDPTRSSKGFFRGDFGFSYLDGRPVSAILGSAVKWTLLINIIVFLIAYSIAIPAGVSLAIHKGTGYDRLMTAGLFVLYSIPSFWVGTMLIIFFTSDYYAGWMNLFPPYGLGKIGPEYTAWAKITDRAYHLILPVFCIVFGQFAFISRQVRGGMLSVLRQDFIRTAFAKGLAPGQVFWRHAFRNSLIPLITLFSSFLPAMISGAVIIEYLFTIPGMGRVSYESVEARNYPVLFTILMFSALLTMAGTLLSDILYVITDPRVSFTKKDG